MPSPSSTLGTLRTDLSGAMQELDLFANEQGFIGYQIFRPIDVAHGSGEFGKVPIKSLLRTIPTERAPNSGYNRSTWDFTSDTYRTKEHGTETPVDARDASFYRDYVDAERVTAERCRHIVLQNAEIRIADIVQDSATFTPTGISDEWDDHDAAVPLTDVENAVQRLWNKGIMANCLILTRKQFRNLRMCEQIISKVASSGAGSSVLPAQINTNHLSQAFDIKHILVANGIKNTAQDGQAASTTGIWSDEYAAVTRIAETDDIAEPCFGRTFHWTEDGSQIGGTIESYDSPEVRGTVIRCRHDVHEKVIYPEALELLDNAITI